MGFPDLQPTLIIGRDFGASSFYDLTFRIDMMGNSMNLPRLIITMETFQT